MATDNNVPVSFTAQTGDLLSGLKSVETGLKSLSSNAEEISESFKAAGAAFASAFAIDKVVDLEEAFATLGSQIQHTTQIIGTSARELQQWQFYASLSGTSADSVGGLIEKLGRNVAAAARGTGDASQAFKDLGVNVKDSEGHILPLTDVLGQVAQKFSQTADGVTKLDYATAIGGRGFADFIPILNKGPEALEELNRKLEETGSRMSEDLVAKFDETDSKVTIFEASVKGLGLTIADGLRPAFDTAIEGLTELIQYTNQETQSLSPLRVALLAVTAVFDTMITLVDGLIQGFRVMWQVFALVAEGIGESAALLGTVLSDVFSGNFKEAAKDFTNMTAAMEANAKQRFENIGKIADGFTSRMLGTAKGFGEEAFGTGGKKPDGTPKVGKPSLPARTDASELKRAQEEAKNIALDGLEARRAIDAIGLADRKKALDDEVKLGLITEQQKIQMLMDFENQSYALDVQAIQSEMEVANLTKLERAKMYNDLLVMKAKHEAQVRDLSRQSALEQAKIYQRVGDTIKNAFKGTVTGVLQGTQSIGQALQNMAVNVVASLAEMFAEMALDWLINQVTAKVTAASIAMTAIGANAATAGAAAYASTAAIPVVGPALAPAAAAQAYTTTMGFQALVPSFDVGAYDLPGDTFAKVHQGEMILDRSSAQTFREGIEGKGGGMGGGGITINAVDARSVEQLLKRNSRTITKIGKMSQRNFSTNMKPGR